MAVCSQSHYHFLGDYYVVGWFCIISESMLVYYFNPKWNWREPHCPKCLQLSWSTLVLSSPKNANRWIILLLPLHSSPLFRLVGMGVHVTDVW